MLSQRLVGEAKTTSIKLIHQGNPVDAIWFGRTEPLPARVLLAFPPRCERMEGRAQGAVLVEGAQV